MSKENNEKNSGKKWIFLTAGIIIGVLIATSIGYSIVQKNKNDVDTLSDMVNTLITKNEELKAELSSFEDGDSEKEENQEEDSNIIELQKEKKELEIKIEKLTKEIQSKSTSDNTQISVIYSNGTSTLKVITLAKGGSVKSSDIPTVPEKEGYDASWSSDGKNVQSSIVIYPIYTPKTYNINYILGNHEALGIVEIYSNNDSTFVLRVNNSGTDAVLSLTSKYSVNSNGEFEFLGETFKIVDRNSDSCDVLDKDGNTVGDLSYGEVNLYNFGVYFVLFNSEGYLKCEDNFSIHTDITGGNFVFAGTNYNLDRENKVVTNIETRSVIATLSRYEFLNLYYNAKTNKFTENTNDPIDYTYSNGVLLVGSNKYYIDFNNLQVFYLRNNDEVNWLDSNNNLPTSYTYGSDVKIIYSGRLVTHPSGYDMNDETIGIYSLDSILSSVGLVNGTLFLNPVGDINVVICMSHNPS